MGDFFSKVAIDEFEDEKLLNFDDICSLVVLCEGQLREINKLKIHEKWLDLHFAYSRS